MRNLKRLIIIGLGIIYLLMVGYVIWLFLIPKPEFKIIGNVPNSSEARVSLLEIDKTGSTGLFSLDRLSLNKSGEYCISQIYLKDQDQFLRHSLPSNTNSFLATRSDWSLHQSVFIPIPDNPICSNGSDSYNEWTFPPGMFETKMSLTKLVPSTFYPYDNGLIAAIVVVEFEQTKDDTKEKSIEVPTNLVIATDTWEISEINNQRYYSAISAARKAGAKGEPVKAK